MNRQSLRTAGIFFVIALLLPYMIAAQTKYPVEVAHSGDDSVGTMYAFELREAIRGSHGMRLVEGSLEPRIKVVIVTIDTDTPHRGLSSAIAVTILYDSVDIPLEGAHLTTMVHVCGRSAVQSCARRLLSSIDSEVTRLRDRSPRLWGTLFRRN